jgi:hypothetical protein
MLPLGKGLLVISGTNIITFSRRSQIDSENFMELGVLAGRRKL